MITQFDIMNNRTGATMTFNLVQILPQNRFGYSIPNTTNPYFPKSYPFLSIVPLCPGRWRILCQVGLSLIKQDDRQVSVCTVAGQTLLFYLPVLRGGWTKAVGVWGVKGRMAADESIFTCEYSSVTPGATQNDEQASSIVGLIVQLSIVTVLLINSQGRRRTVNIDNFPTKLSMPLSEQPAQKLSTSWVVIYVSVLSDHWRLTIKR